MDVLLIVSMSIFVIVGAVVLFVSIWAIYVLISSNFMRTPPLVWSSGWAYEGIVDKVGKQIGSCLLVDTVSPFNIVDAGSGIGTLIIPLAKKFPEHHFVGIEIAWLPYIFAKFRGRKIKNLKIIHQDIFDYDFSEFNFVICFLIESMMERFSQKLLDELIQETYVFSNRFMLKNISPIETMDFGNHYAYVHLYKICP